MNTMRCAEIRLLLGVYVTGAIEPAERARVESHLKDCPDCRDELAGMAGLPALLGRVSEGQIAQITGPPEELLDSLLSRAAEARRPHRFRRWAPLAAAAVIMLAVGGLFGGLLQGDSGGGQGAFPTPSATTTVPTVRIAAENKQTHVKAEVELQKKRWGTLVVVRVTGAPQGVICHLRAMAMDGEGEPLGSWKVPVSRGTGSYTASTRLDQTELRSFDIVTLEGQTLVTIPV